MMQLAHQNVAQPKRGAFRFQVCLCWTTPAGDKANSKLIVICLLPTRQDLTQGQWPEGRLLWGTSQGSNPVGLCWSSTHLVQCEPDEHSWTWTQTWVQVRMPDYSLNWTSKSIAILVSQWLLRAHPNKRARNVRYNAALTIYRVTGIVRSYGIDR